MRRRRSRSSSSAPIRWAPASSGAWSGPAALQLFAHALAPVAQLPVLEVVSGVHIVSDLTLGLGTVVHDYLAKTKDR